MVENFKKITKLINIFYFEGLNCYFVNFKDWIDLPFGSKEITHMFTQTFNKNFDFFLLQY